MTKGGSGKPKTLGRLIFGDKRKPHASPVRQRSATRHSTKVTDPPSSATTTNVVNKTSINLQDWAVWRIQLNEQMCSAVGDIRADLKQMRHFLQSNSFYQQNSRDSTNGQYNGVGLLFSIPRANLNLDLFGELRDITKNNKPEIEESKRYNEKKVRSNSDDRTTTSVNSISAVQAAINDKPISELLPKTSIGNMENSHPTNEPMKISDRIHPRRSIRHSFIATDRIHATLQKAVKDGNVLAKIKAFEMQAAAAQAESVVKPISVNYRMQSITSSIQSNTQHGISPAVVNPTKNAPSPIPTLCQKQPPVRSSRGRYVHPIQQQPYVNHDLTTGHKSRKGAHVLEPAHGDIILKRRTPSQKTANDEDYSITGISSMAMTTSQGGHRNSSKHGHHHRTSLSRSRHRQEAIYEKHGSTKNDNMSHKQHHKSKDRPTSSSKVSTHHRWLKGRKGTPTDAPHQVDKKQNSSNKSTKNSTSKKKSNAQEKSNSSKKVPAIINKEKVATDNNRVYGVPSATINEQTKTELPPLKASSKMEENKVLDPKTDTKKDTNAFISSPPENMNSTKECDIIMPMKLQRRSSKSSHHQKLSNIEGDILSKVDDKNRFCRITTDDHVCRPDYNDDMVSRDNDDGVDNDKTDDDVFLEDAPIKITSNINRHQSVLNVATNESRRFQQQSSCTTIRRHASQCSSNEFSYDQRYQQTKENSQLITTNILKKKSAPITIITRKNRSTYNEQLTYEGPESEQIEIPLSNNAELKKKRPFNVVNTTGGTQPNNGQSNAKQVSKQILHAIMNSMNNNQEPSTIGPTVIASSPTVNDEFFENGPLTNPEETIANLTSLVSK